MDPQAPGPNEARSIIDYWNPFNKRDSFATHMCELYPNLLRIPMATHAEKYSIPFLSYMDKKSYQRVTKDIILFATMTLTRWLS